MKLVSTALLLLSSLTVFGAGSEATIPLKHVEPDFDDKASLQRGARTYMNYCLGCHSLQYQRYQRTAEDLDIPKQLMLEHLIFDQETRIGSLIENSMSESNAKEWFGASPPDLTLYTSLKGTPDYLYTYLKSFYHDPSRPLGVNNLLYENVGMPHALLDLQGLPRKVCKTKLEADGSTQEPCNTDDIVDGRYMLEVDGRGKLSPAEYDQLVYDLTNFLYYVAEPTRNERERLGFFVLLFLAFFFVPAYLLGKEYTKEFH